MIDRIRQICEKYRDELAYVVFGVITTGTNWAFFLICHEMFDMSSTVSETVAWLLSVLVAFLTNKPFVFHSHDWSFKTVCPEFTKFMGTRAGSGVLDIALMYLTVDLWCMDAYLMKIVISVLVIIINYIGSKMLVFRKK